MRPSLFPEASSTMRRKAFRAEADLDITPMIDVTFLLLIFFMVTSTMQPPAIVEVPAARSGTGIDKAKSIIFSISYQGGEPTIIFGDTSGRPVGLEEIEQVAQTELEAGKSEVIIKAGKNVPHGVVADVAKQLSGFDEVRYFLGVTDPQVQ